MSMDISKTVDALRENFWSGVTRPYSFRAEALEKLKDVIVKREDAIFEAMRADLGKSAYESYMSEVGLVLAQIDLTLKHLGEWMEPVRGAVGLAQFPSTARVLPEPYGVVLVMAPWNYPFMLTMEPLVGAIAAGNTVLLQPSDYSPHTSQCIADLMQEIYPANYVSVVLGGHHDNPTLLDHHFDYIFFTGSTRIGKIVQMAAAQFTTPVTLELGGMSPCIVDETADIKIAGKRIMFGKVLNSGQTCVAPDYVYVQQTVYEPLLKSMKAALEEFFPSGALECSDYPHMINEKAYERVVGLMEGASVAYGGKTKPETLQIEPTILTDVTWESKVMSEEIFGPLMPVMTYDALDEVISAVRPRPRPLACYIFTKDDKTVHRIETELSYGGGAVNDTAMQVAVSDIPFGGVGASGMGMYHGKYSFDTFTHYKSMLDKATWADLPERYYPYTEKKFKVVKKVLH